MSFIQARLLSKVLNNPTTLRSRILLISCRLESTDGGAPYRPGPFEKYFWPKAASHWLPQYPTQSAKQDEYPKEEIYLHEIEARMRTYDEKYSQSERVKSLYNEFGWDVWDDRAQHTYGLSDDQSLIHGPGKKIDPDHYVNAAAVQLNRKVIAPIQYMTAEQIRRSRGSLANLREFPAEHPSIFKYWNGVSTLGVFVGLLVSKEWFLVGGHDFWDAMMLWGIFGVVGAFAADFIAWWNAVVAQESFDKEYFQLMDNVKRMNEQLMQFNTKPYSERQQMMNLIAYKDSLSEKVLQKSISNRVSQIYEETQKELANKVMEESAFKKEVKVQWNRDALAATYAYFDEEKVKEDFTRQALEKFLAPDFAKVGNETKTVFMDGKEVKDKYMENLEMVERMYMNEHREKGSLSWVFVDKSEKQVLSAADKIGEYEKRVAEWCQGRNVVHAPTPAFS